MFALRTFLELFVNWTHLVADQHLVFVNRHAALFELPLTFEECGLVYECKQIVEFDVFDDTRSEERRFRNRDVSGNVGTSRVRAVADWFCASRPRRFANTEFRLFTYQIF